LVAEIRVWSMESLSTSPAELPVCRKTAALVAPVRLHSGDKACAPLPGVISAELAEDTQAKLDRGVMICSGGTAQRFPSAHTIRAATVREWYLHVSQPTPTLSNPQHFDSKTASRRLGRRAATQRLIVPFAIQDASQLLSEYPLLGSHACANRRIDISRTPVGGYGDWFWASG
jgi:hypothetical protein